MPVNSVLMLETDVWQAASYASRSVRCVVLKREWFSVSRTMPRGEIKVLALSSVKMLNFGKECKNPVLDAINGREDISIFSKWPSLRTLSCRPYTFADS